MVMKIRLFFIIWFFDRIRSSLPEMGLFFFADVIS